MYYVKKNNQLLATDTDLDKAIETFLSHVSSTTEDLTNVRATIKHFVQKEGIFGWDGLVITQM